MLKRLFSLFSSSESSSRTDGRQTGMVRHGDEWKWGHVDEQPITSTTKLACLSTVQPSVGFVVRTVTPADRIELRYTIQS
jgi:hypothetical protein